MSTEAIEHKLAQRFADVRNGKRDLTIVSFEFEDDVQCMWDTTQRIEPVLYLWEKYYDVQIPSPGDPAPVRFGHAVFVSNMAHLAATPKLSKSDQELIVSSAVTFVTRHESDMDARLTQMGYLADRLIYEGLVKQGQRIGRAIEATSPGALRRLFGEDLAGISEEVGLLAH